MLKFKIYFFYPLLKCIFVLNIKMMGEIKHFIFNVKTLGGYYTQYTCDSEGYDDLWKYCINNAIKVIGVHEMPEE